MSYRAIYIQWRLPGLGSRVAITSTLYQLPVHHQFFPLQLSHHPERREEVSVNSQPVFWSLEMSESSQVMHFHELNCEYSAAGLNIIVRMQIKCETKSRYIWISCFWAAWPIGPDQNIDTADQINFVTNTDRHCWQDTPRSGCRLGGHPECAENKYQYPVTAASNYASHWAVKMLKDWMPTQCKLRKD